MARRADPNKPKRSFNDIFRKYKTYDPTVEGYGNVDDWRSAFYTRMGDEEAARVVSESKKTPRSILGLAESAGWSEIKSAFRHLALQYHPDRIAYTGLTKDEAENRMKELTAAVQVLENQYK